MVSLVRAEEVNGHTPSSIVYHAVMLVILRSSFVGTWREAWNMYKCQDITYRMLILESLDADTERRRLSPIAIASEGKWLKLTCFY